MKLKDISIRDPSHLIDIERQGFKHLVVLITEDNEGKVYDVLSKSKTREGSLLSYKRQTAKRFGVHDGGQLVVLPIQSLLLAFGSSVRGEEAP